MKKLTITCQFKHDPNQSGQALVPLLIFVVVGIAITTFSISILITNSLNASRYSQGEQALTIAESGIENAMMRLLRNASYTGETLAVGDGQAVVTVTGNDPYIVTSVGTLNDHSRTIRIEVTRDAGLFTITNWQDTP